MRIKFLVTVVSCVLFMKVTPVSAHETTHTSTKPCAHLNADKSVQQKNNKHVISTRLEQLTDNTGLTYIAVPVQQEDLTVFLSQLADILKDDFDTFRQGQQTRDHNQFHITIVNPYEFEALEPKYEELLTENIELSFNLIGLGHASNDKSQTYFIVAESIEGQKLRAKLGLKDKDFHVTLGFKPQDVYGVKKNRESLINKP